jgi:hypothetical protein
MNVRSSPTPSHAAESVLRANKPRVIVELNADHTLTIEYYINGQREIHTLPRGSELYGIKDALLEIERNFISRAEAKANGEVAKAVRRHRAVWDDVAAHHGNTFANKTVGERNGKIALGHMVVADENLL